MKHYLLTTLFCGMCAIAIAQTANSVQPTALSVSPKALANDERFELNNMTFGVLSADTKVVKLVKFTDKTATTVTIPSEVTYDNVTYSVAAIGQGAFNAHPTIEKIILEEGVEEIGQNAFDGCQQLKTVLLPMTISSLGAYAFNGCTALDNVVLPENLSFDEYVFNDCSGLTTVTVSDGTYYLPDGTFYGCTSLKNIRLPYDLESIGELAFGSCESLTTLEIPTSVNQIYDHAFEGAGIKHLYVHNNAVSLTNLPTDSDLPKSATVYVPEGQKELFLTMHPSWQSFTMLEWDEHNIETSVKTINIFPNKAIVAIYDLQGKAHKHFVKGINVVKYTDGSVQKIQVN